MYASQWLKRAAFACFLLSFLSTTFSWYVTVHAVQSTHWQCIGKKSTILHFTVKCSGVHCTVMHCSGPGWKELPCLPLLASLAPPVKHHDTPPSTSSHHQPKIIIIKNIISVSKIYLSKFQNVLVNISKSICLNLKIDLFKLENAFVSSKKIYLS